ncbi:MAG: hypothetical protein WA045_11780, partial [Nitrospira sp.]
MNTEIDYEARKAEIIADSSKFQRVCSTFVGRNVEHCMSSLFYDIGRNLEDCARIFDFDYDEAMRWFSSEDWEEVVRAHIFDDADLDDLEKIVGLCDEDWDDILDGVGYNVYVATCEEDEDGDDPDDFEDWLKGQDECHDEKDSFTLHVRNAVWMMVTGDYYRKVGEEFGLDPDQREVFEHWSITRNLGTLLQFH